MPADPTPRAESPSAEAMEVARAIAHERCRNDRHRLTAIGAKTSLQRDCYECIGEALDAFSAARVRAAIERVLEIVERKTSRYMSDGHAGDWSLLAMGKDRIEIAEEIRTAFPAPASAAAEREEGA